MSYFQLDHLYKVTEASQEAELFRRYMIVNIIFTIGVVIIFFFFFSYIHRRLEGFLNNIRENEQAYKALAEQYQLAIEGTNDGLWDWNIADDSIYFSPRWKEMLGYRDDELKNEFDTWQSRVHPDDLQPALELIERAHADPNVEYKLIHRLRHKDGHWVWILDRGQTIFDENGKPVRMIGFHTDITEQKELEIKLHEKEEIMIAQSRHAAMGEMISMIAHQWRQPISVIAMDANNILADVELDMLQKETLAQTSKDIIAQTQELSKTIDDFREFFKPNKDVEDIVLKDVVHDALAVVGKSLENNNITVEIDVCKPITISTYSRELMQVLINIIKNAKEVLVEKEQQEKKIMFHCKHTKSSITMSICDNGGGINPEIMDKIFTPYFTTKGEKNGTGLGLYMSRTIIEKHLKGVILASNSEEGACFTIELPLNIKEGGVVNESKS